MTEADLVTIAIDTIARHLLRHALEVALNFEHVTWADYPELSESHFSAVCKRAETLANFLQSEDPAYYEEAYALLSG